MRLARWRPEKVEEVGEVPDAVAIEAKVAADAAGRRLLFIKK